MEDVRIWEEDVSIPTYEVGEPDKNPMFLEKRVYQGSSGKIYPYPSTNKISREKKDHIWHAVWLENQYIKVMVLPELGGRIQRAYDKTNDYDFVYYNHVIKPALVGLTGPWISGGIEFNWPQHHRPTTYMPVEYKIVKGNDGSMTLLTGDVDQMYGTKEVTGFTLYPDRAYIEIRGQLYNRTPFPQTFLWWANPAVSVNDHTQSIFPPDVHSVYDHGKRAVSRFPIATGEYYKHDYSDGVDISRYKNIPVPTSYMAESSGYNFVGGYDYSKGAGLLHVADHHVSPGKKQWTWGCGDFGKAWDRNLTDEDGPYIELMTGMYCDNQPDFTWLKPYEEKVFKQYFMPYKAVGQVKNASIHAALNMELREKGLYVCIYATREYKGAMLTVFYNDKEVYSESVDVSPVKIYEKEIPIEAEDEYEIRVTLSYNGRELVSYQPVDQGIPKLAEPQAAAKRPEEIITNEELYITGQHIEQYRHATWLPDPYYEEGIKRDPLDIRINNAYGLLMLRRGRFELAEGYFRQALKRLTSMHPNPYDSEPYYNLGLSLFYQGKYDGAYDSFYKATWVSELQEMSYYYLAVISCLRGDCEEALELADKGLVKNVHNIKARGLRAVILHYLGRDKEALSYIEESLGIDAFDYMSLFEKALILDDASVLEQFHSLTGEQHERFLQCARDFGEAGFYKEALSVLREYRGENPMICYYRGYNEKCLGNMDAARAEFEVGEKASCLYCFPNKTEDIAVLKAAIESLDRAPRARYYLGCLYYDKLQYDLAISLWEDSAKEDDSFPTVFRNLSIAYYNKSDEKEKALSCLEKAFELDPGDARVFLELDQLYQKLQHPLEERAKKYRDNISLIEERDDLYTEYVTLLNSIGDYEEAYRLIKCHSFQTWEGAEGKITAQFKLSLLEMAKKDMAENKFDRAKEKLTEAVSYPENLGEGRLEGTKDNHIYYHLGLVCSELHEEEQAGEYFEKATLGAMEVAGMMYYYDQPADMILYQGLALEKLGRQSEANSRFYRLLDFGEQHIRDVFRMDYFAVSMPDMSVFDADMDAKNVAHCYFVMGLAYLGLGDKKKASENFQKVLQLDNSHQNAILFLRRIEK